LTEGTLATAPPDFRRTPNEPAGDSLRSRHGREAIDLKEVPEPKALREQIRSRTLQLASTLDTTRPLTRQDIERLARRVTSDLDLRESFVGWTMVILASTFWAAQVRRVPVNRRLLLLPLP